MKSRSIIIILIEVLYASMALSQETFSQKLLDNDESVDSTSEAIYERQSRLIIAETYAIDSSVELKSPFLAFSASLAGLILPMAASPFMIQDLEDRHLVSKMLVLSTCLIIGPAAGYSYADLPKYAFGGMKNRTAVALSGLFIGSVGVVVARDGGGFIGAKGVIALSSTAATIVTLVGFGIYDIAKVAGRVSEKNAKLMKQNKESVSIVPIYFADSGAGGLQFNFNF